MDGVGVGIGWMVWLADEVGYSNVADSNACA